MNSSHSRPSSFYALRAALEQARDTAGDQIAAAGEIHLARAFEALSQEWEETLSRIVRERFDDLAASLEEEFQRCVNERVAASVETAAALAKDLGRRELSEFLNRGVRRLRQAETRSAWGAALLDLAQEFAERCVLLQVGGHHFRFAGARPESGELAAAFGDDDQYLRDAPALKNVLETRDTMVVLKRAEDLGERIVSALGGGSGDARVYLFPVVSGPLSKRVAAILMAEGADNPVDVNAMELLCSAAVAGLQNLDPASERPPGLVSVVQAPAGAAAPDWTSMPREEQDAHLRAQRFARVQVAEMRLYKSAQVRQGRAERNLYAFLKEDIDRTREAYRRLHLQTVPSMVDYLHRELVKTLANDDPSLLGPDYPGPLR